MNEAGRCLIIQMRNLILSALILASAFQTMYGATVNITEKVLSGGSLKLTGGNTYVFSFSSFHDLTNQKESWPTSYSTSGFGISSSTDVYGNPPVDMFTASDGNSADLLSIKLNYGANSQEYRTYNFGGGSYITLPSRDNLSGQNGGRLYDADPAGNLTITMLAGNADISNITIWSSFGSERMQYTASYNLANPVPEPSSLSLLVLGGAVVALCRRKRA